MAKQKHIEVIVDELPDCNFCAEEGRKEKASYDGKTKNRVWAYMCYEHFTRYGIGLGLGMGQRLVLRNTDTKTK